MRTPSPSARGGQGEVLTPPVLSIPAADYVSSRYMAETLEARRLVELRDRLNPPEWVLACRYLR